MCGARPSRRRRTTRSGTCRRRWCTRTGRCARLGDVHARSRRRGVEPGAVVVEVRADRADEHRRWPSTPCRTRCCPDATPPDDRSSTRKLSEIRSSCSATSWSANLPEAHEVVGGDGGGHSNGHVSRADCCDRLIATDHLIYFPGRFADQLLADRSTASRCRSWSMTSSSSARVRRQHRLRPRGARPRAAARRRGGRRLRRVPRLAHVQRRRLRGRARLPDVQTAGSCAPPTTTCARSRRSTPAPWPGPGDRPRPDRRAWPGPRAGRRQLPGGHAPPHRPCRELGIPFAADPSQQLARMDGPQIRRLVDGARTCSATTTSGSCCCRRPAGPRPTSPSASTSGSPRTARRASRSSSGTAACSRWAWCPRRAWSTRRGSATGSGRASSPGSTAGLSLERAAQLGSLIAVLVLETDGPQDWTWDRAQALETPRRRLRPGRRRGDRRRRPGLTARRGPAPGA